MTLVDTPKRITITKVAQMTGISAKTITRWEKIGKIPKAKRNWRGWRIYGKEDVLQIKVFLETVFEAEQIFELKHNGTILKESLNEKII